MIEVLPYLHFALRWAMLREEEAQRLSKVPRWLSAEERRYRLRRVRLRMTLERCDAANNLPEPERATMAAADLWWNPNDRERCAIFSCDDCGFRLSTYTYPQGILRVTWEPGEGIWLPKAWRAEIRELALGLKRNPERQ